MVRLILVFQLLNSEDHIDDGQFGEEKVQRELVVSFDDRGQTWWWLR